MIPNTPSTQSNSILQDYARDNETEQQLAINPDQAVLMLLEGAIEKGTLALVSHNNRSMTEKGFHLGRMTSIVDALRDRLDFGYKIAYDLETLYFYIDRSLQAAVFEQGTESLEAAIQMLNEIQTAWIISMESAEEMSA